MAPSDEDATSQILYTGYQHQGPAAVRYPRGTGTGAVIDKTMTALPMGKGLVKREGSRVAILNFGTLLGSALEAGEQLDATVVDMRFVKPLDKEIILSLAKSHALLVTLEENSIAGGAGSAVSELLAEQAVVMPILQLGLPDQFIDHANHQQQLEMVGLDAQQILSRIQERLDRI